MGLVKHSQRLTAPPLKVWVATKQQGEVLCAHCVEARVWAASRDSPIL